MSALARSSIAAAVEDAAPNRVAPVRLHRNENAFGPSPAVTAAIRDASPIVNRYPEAVEEALRDRLAALHHVAPSNVVLGCGSSEILRLVSEVFAGSGKSIVMALPSFGPMADCARRSGANVVAVPLTSRYAHDLDAMRSKIDGETGLVYVCNPNNPTGTLTGRRDLESFLGGLPVQTHVLIDEAYHQYADGASDTHPSSIVRLEISG